MDFFEFSAGQNLIYESNGNYVEGSSDETNLKKSSAVSKTIKKYEPIVDNSIVYRYEDNPDEYRRMRKKQQNRESATRVRYRQKTHTEQVEHEVNELKQINAQLQLTNAKLQAENTVLKQQISFFQNLMQSTTPVEDPQQGKFELERVPTQRRHFAFLTIMTAVLCVVFANSDDFGRSQEQLALQLQLNQTSKFDNLQTLDVTQWHQSTEYISQVVDSTKYEAMKLAAQYSLCVAYLVYLGYILTCMKCTSVLKRKTKIL